MFQHSHFDSVAKHTNFKMSTSFNKIYNVKADYFDAKTPFFSSERFYLWEDIKTILKLNDDYLGCAAPAYKMTSDDGQLGVCRPGIQQLLKHSTAVQANIDYCNGLW